MFEFKYKDYSFHCEIGTMTPLQYIKMIYILEDLKPKRICELGSGVSTEIFDVYCKKEDSIRFSIEHDEFYKRYNHTIMMPLIENSSLNLNGHSYKNCCKYGGFEDWLYGQNGFDLIFIDGPNDGIPFNPYNLEYARVQLFDFVLMDKLNNECVVMYHDSERDVAQNTLNEFERLLTDKGYAYQKEVVVEKDKEIIEYNKITLGVCPELTSYKIDFNGNKRI